jgi:PPOX class probable F420-dependent enzyme
LPAIIPAGYADLLAKEKKAFAHVAVTLSDGTPQVSPIWFDYDGTHIILNTARGRLKDRAMSRQRYAALSIMDPDDWHRYLLIRGPVVEETETGAWEVICDLREKYHGDRNFPRRPGQVRVTYKILPEHIYPGD